MKLFKNFNKFYSSIALIDTNNNQVSYRNIQDSANNLKNKLKKNSLVLIAGFGVGYSMGATIIKC